jgi:hypothetical protein
MAKPLDMSQYEVVGGAAPEAAPPPGKPLDPARYEPVAAAPVKPVIARGKAALATTLQGTTAGFADELGGVGGSIGEALHAIINEGRLPTVKEMKNAYTGSRDMERKYVGQATEAYPVQSGLTEFAGSLAIPLPGAGAAVKGAVKAVGLGRKALAVARALAPAAMIGGVAGVGYEEGQEGKVSDAGDLGAAGLKGALYGAGSAAALKVAGAAVKTGGGWAARKIRTFGKNIAANSKEADEVKTIILDQIARSEEGATATPTAKKRLAVAGNAVYDEIISGPDGRAVQEIVQDAARKGGSARKGLEQLAPIIDKVAEANHGHYDRFERAGQHVVDIHGDYLPRLRKAEATFRREGDARMADGLAAVREKMASEAEAVQPLAFNRTKGVPADGGVTDLKWLRKHTTTFQDAAASKLGGLNEHEKARTAKLVAREAKGILDEIIDAKAAGNNGLTGAAGAIRANNRRLFGLLSIQDALESRAVKEEVTGGTLERAGNRLARAAKGGLLGAAAGAAVGGGNEAHSGGEGGDIVDKALSWGTAGALAGGAAAMSGRLGQKADRYLTGKVIDRLREAATGRADPAGTIRDLARQFNLPERAVRAAYIRLVVK